VRALDEPVAEVLAQPNMAIGLDTASIVHFKDLRNHDFSLSPAPPSMRHQKRSTSRCGSDAAEPGYPANREVLMDKVAGCSPANAAWARANSIVAILLCLGS
jgi:hypothetical protein